MDTRAKKNAKNAFTAVNMDGPLSQSANSPVANFSVANRRFSVGPPLSPTSSNLWNESIFNNATRPQKERIVRRQVVDIHKAREGELHLPNPLRRWERVVEGSSASRFFLATSLACVFASVLFAICW